MTSILLFCPYEFVSRYFIKVELYSILSFYEWFIGIMSSSFIHIVSCARIAFLCKAEWYSIVHLWHILFINLSVSGHSGCFHTLVVVDNTAEKVDVCILPLKLCSYYLLPWGDILCLPLHWVEICQNFKDWVEVTLSEAVPATCDWRHFGECSLALSV